MPASKVNKTHNRRVAASVMFVASFFDSTIQKFYGKTFFNIAGKKSGAIIWLVA
jgi:hypothetical protein